MSEKLHIEGQEIAIKLINDQDYLSLTDIARQRNREKPADIIRNWLSAQDTEDFLEL